jgi:hypothetical protein
LHLLGVYFILNGVAGPLFYVFNHQSRARYGYSLDDLAYAVLLILACWCGIAAGYLSFPHERASAVGNKLFAGRSIRKNWVLPAIVVGWLCRIDVLESGRYFHIASDASALESGPLTFAVSVLAQVPLLVLLLRVAAHNDRLYRDPVIIVLLAGEIGWAAPAGSRASIVTLAFALVVVRYYSTRRIPRSWLAVGLVVSALAFPLVFNYRAWKVANPDSPVSLSSLSAASNSTFVYSLPETIVSRFSDSEAIATAVHQSGYLESLLPFEKLVELTGASVVPRVMWPAKPDANLFGNEFGRSAGAISSSDFVTSVSVPISLMWWFVGGLVGVLVGSYVTGILYRFLDSALACRREGGLGAAVFALSAFLLLTSPATIIPAGVLGVMKSSLTLLILGLVVSRPAAVVRANLDCSVWSDRD